jgi:Mycothiol maleylpyruvate isomerase N-terminal domain
VTACRGWTAHELVAHLAAGAAEEAELIESHLAGARERPTRGFEERELPFRALPDARLRDRLVEEAARLTVALNELSGDSARDGVLFTGRRMTAADFAMHSRSECALHRWDLVGRDDIGWAMLSQPELTAHAITVLAGMSSLPEAPANRLVRERGRRNLRAVVRSAPHDDVVLTLSDGVLTLEQTPIDNTPPSVELDAAARLPLLWVDASRARPSI